ncbi:MAG: DUF4249 domain-containing protein [Bacteroidetes bacterium]|nr:DUF4249 domain-containing protein [Bacteroidota bacterium]
MQVLKNIFPFLIPAVFISACTGAFFETEVELPVPEHDPVLAITAYINSTDDSLLLARVTRTYGLFEDKPFDDGLDDATLELYEEGELIHSFEYRDGPLTNYEAEINEMFDGVGKTYELRATHPVFGTASATQTMPVPVPLGEVNFNELNGGNLGGPTGELEITINDPGDQTNFYELAVLKICTFTFVNPDTGEEITEEYPEGIYFDAEFMNDPNITSGFNSEALLISDQNFNGQSITIRPRFYTCYESESQGGNRFVIHWRTVTQDYFNYSKSLYESLNAQNNPFAEPVSLYSNVEGGIGAFCLRSELIYEVE